MSHVCIRELCRNFGTTRALDRVSFDLPSGQIYGFIGPNGAGKTTLLRILSGLDVPDSGSIRINDEDVTQYPEKLRKYVSLMPDSLPDRADILVWEYLDFYCRANGLTAQMRKDAIARATELTNLTGLMNKALSDLSKGMKQQVSLARLLVHMPDILLLDEPAAGLDPRARVEFRETLFKIAAEGKTVLISSHILSELEDMIQGLVLIEQGKILRSGSMENALSSHRTGNAEALPVILQFPGEAEPYLEKLYEFDFVSSVKPVGPKQIHLMICGGEDEFRKAMSELFLSGLPVCGMQRPDFALEGLFMDVTTKGKVQ